MHESYFLLITDAFRANRLKSENFIQDIGIILRDRKSILVDLKENYEDLIVKSKSIEEDLSEMQKQIAEMSNLMNLRKEKDY